MHKNDYNFEKRTTCLIHLPKTGGTTFTQLVRKYKLDDLYSQKNILANNLHRPISKNCSPNVYNYIIIMRNPVDRVISYYNMVKRNGTNYPHGRFTKDINLFLNNCWEVNNQMTLYMAGINCVCSTVVNENIYEMARANLKKIKHIIFFENYSKNIVKFFLNEYDIVLFDSDIPNLRQHTYSKKISDEDYKLIMDKNKYDILLYKYAIELYNNKSN